MAGVLHSDPTTKKESHQRTPAITDIHPTEGPWDDGLLTVTWSGRDTLGDTSQSPLGDTAQFPVCWLRDNCQCAHCFHPTTYSRRILVADFDVDIKPTHAEVTNEGRVVQITWEDGHVSDYDATWLRPRSFDQTAQTARQMTITRPPVLWGNEMQQDVRRHDFQQILSDEASLHAMICDLEDFGFVMLNNAPQEKGQLLRFAKHISFERTTHYGTSFEVAVKVSPSNLAYTAGSLGLHTDIPYDRYPPGVQLLHYIRQTPMVGGLSQFSDGFQAAAILREEDPQAFDILTRTQVDYTDTGVDVLGPFSKICTQTTITLDLEGQVDKVCFNNQCRDSYPRLPADSVYSLMSALKKFNSILYRSENVIELKPQAGDVSVFYNNRVLHGRTAYEMTSGGDRYLEGMYIDIDELVSRRRIIAHTLGLLG